MDEMTETRMNDRVWSQIDRIAGPFFPPKSRKYISFLWMTVFVLCIFAFNLALKLFIAGSTDRSRFVAAERFLHEPLFIVPYDVGLFLVLLFVFASNASPAYEYLRALIFGMVLAAILGQILVFFVPW
jgi:hypothetical protein